MYAQKKSLRSPSRLFFIHIFLIVIISERSFPSRASGGRTDSMVEEIKGEKGKKRMSKKIWWELGFDKRKNPE